MWRTHIQTLPILRQADPFLGHADPTLRNADIILVMFIQGEGGSLSSAHDLHTLQGAGRRLGSFSTGAGKSIAVGKLVLLLVLCGRLPAGRPA